MQNFLLLPNGLINYWNSIKSGTEHFDNIKELFLYRLSAFMHLSSSIAADQAIARAFLELTMRSPETYNFEAKIALLKNIRFLTINLQCWRDDEKLKAIVYCLTYQENEIEKTSHEISFFTTSVENKLVYTHKYDLDAALKELELFSQTASAVPIIQIGDPSVHRPGIFIQDFNHPLLIAQTQQAKHDLIATGGVGIAANQCIRHETAKGPFAFFYAGIDYTQPTQVALALQRYPTALFPPAKLYFNPRIITASEKHIPFTEGCLSVKTPMRGAVLRPEWVEIAYQDIKGDFYTEKFTGVDARVIQHEMDHINEGKVYFEHILEELNHAQLQALYNILSQDYPNYLLNQGYKESKIVFEYDQQNQLKFNVDAMKEALLQTPTSVRTGLKEKVMQKLNATP